MFCSPVRQACSNTLPSPSAVRAVVLHSRVVTPCCEPISGLRIVGIKASAKPTPCVALPTKNRPRLPRKESKERRPSCTVSRSSMTPGANFTFDTPALPASTALRGAFARVGLQPGDSPRARLRLELGSVHPIESDHRRQRRSKYRQTDQSFEQRGPAFVCQHSWN